MSRHTKLAALRAREQQRQQSKENSMQPQPLEIIREQSRVELMSVMLDIHNAEVRLRELKRRRDQLMMMNNGFNAVDELGKKIAESAKAQQAAEDAIEAGKKKAADEVKAKGANGAAGAPQIPAVPPAANDPPAPAA